MRPKSENKTETFWPSVTGDGDAGLFGGLKLLFTRAPSSAAPDGFAAQAIEATFSAAVRKMRGSASTGDECPGGIAADQATFFCGENSAGKGLSSATPLPFGQRFWGQSAAESARHRNVTVA
jgi:hypothetical protein